MENKSVPFSYHWVILGVGTLSVFGALGLGRFGYTIVLPAMQRGLALNNTQAGVLATANLAGYLLLSAAGGALAAHLGPRRIVAAGLALAGLGMALTGLAGGFLTAAFWRALTGLGSGAANVAVMGMMAAWFAPSRRGLAAGVAVSGSSLALMLLGPLAPLIMAAGGEAGWRACWFSYGAANLVLAIVAVLLLRNRPEELGLKPLGQGSRATDPPGEGAGWGRVYGSPRIWHLGLVYTSFGFAYIIYMTFFTKRLVAEGGYSQAAAGGLFTVIGWCSLFCGLIWGWVSDRVGRRGALATIYLLQSAAYAVFGLKNTPAAFLVSAVLFGLTAWSIPAVMAAACGDELGPRLAPAALGFVTLFFGLGQAVGPSVAGAMADASGSFSSAFVLAAGVSLLGAIGTAFLRPPSVCR